MTEHDLGARGGSTPEEPRHIVGGQADDAAPLPVGERIASDAVPGSGGPVGAGDAPTTAHGGKTLTCPNCKASFEPTPNVHGIVCPSCGRILRAATPTYQR